MAMGGLGGLGGVGFGDVLGALGQSLLTSPSNNWLQGLPAGMQAAQQAGAARASDAAMVMALTKAGIDPATAGVLAKNPTAAALMISQGNTQKTQALREQAIKSLGGSSLMPPGVGGLGGLGGASQSDAGPVNERAAPLAQKLIDRGIEPVVAAGIVGNIGAESGFNTGASGDQGTAFGLIQARGPRFEALKSLAAQQGKPWQDEDVQVDHIVSELNGSEKAAYDKARQAKDPAQAAYILAQHYERPAASALEQSAPRRMAIAQQVYGGLGPTADTDTSGLPRNQVASAGKIPVAIPQQSLPQAPPVAAGANRTKAWANSRAQAALGLMIAAGDDKGLQAAAKSQFDIAAKYLTPTEVEKTLDAANVSGPQRSAMLLAAADKRPEAVRVAEAAYPGQSERQRQAIQAGLPDHRPDVVKLGQAQQDTPGLVTSGIEAQASQKGADTAATKRAEALNTEAAAATNSGRAAKQVITSLNEAERFFKQAAEGKGTGPAAANTYSRSVVATAAPEWSQSYKNEVARQNFEKAIATVKNMKTVAEQKGTGPLSNFERELAAADLPTLDVAHPDVALNAFKRIRDRLNDAIELDRKFGLHQGENPTAAQAITTPYGTLRLK